MADMGKRNHYIDREEFAAALLESQKLGTPTERVCRLFRTLIDHYLRGARYSRYDADDKADMASAAFEKCLKNIKNFKESGSPFSYFTRAVECGCLSFLKKHYRQKNIIKDLAESCRQAIGMHDTPPTFEGPEEVSSPGPAN